jgi:galactonate dehydratase
MKVTGVKTMVVENEEPFIGGPYFLFVLVETEEGITGLGEKVTGSSFRGLDWKSFQSQIQLIHETAEAFVIGESPFNIEKIWQNAYGSRHDYRHPSLHYTSVIAAFDIALWDIVGKATNQPIYNLLGGKYHEKLRAYAYMPNGWQESSEKAGEIAQQLLEEGNSACKLDPFMPTHPGPRDISLSEIKKAAGIFEGIRNAVGDEMEVGIGTHGQLTTYSAIRAAKILEEYNPFWFEEPVPPENIDEMARVASQTSIPIASGERLVTKYEFAQLIEKQAAQIIQIDVGQAGGITEAVKVAAIADAHYAMIAPHMYCGPIAAAAAIQVDVCSPNFVIQEANQGPLHKRIFKEPLVFENGYIIPPEGPGLGVELDMDVVKDRVLS